MDQRADLQQLARQVIDLLESDLRADGFDLVDVRLFRGGGRLQVRIYVDADGGVTLDGCATASRTAGMLLEEADPFPGRYVIEVSSPGIRRPLRTLAHYTAAVGERVDLKVRAADGSRRIKGELVAVENEDLLVAGQGAGDDNEAAVRVAHREVLEGNLDPDFDAQALINADRRRRKEEKRADRSRKRKVKKARPRAGKKNDAAPGTETQE